MVISLVVLLAALAGAKSAGLIGQPETLKVQVAEISRTTIIEKVTASGVVRPETEIIISPDVAGEIIELNVEEGDHVTEGMVLVKIRPDNLQAVLDRTLANLNQQKANLSSSKAAVARSKAQVTQTSLAFKRAEGLRKENVISDADYETAKVNYEVAQQNLISAQETVKAAEFIVKSSQASVEEAQENVRLTVVRAPANGTISKLSVKKGERVVGTRQQAGTEMMRVADLTQMQVNVNVNENDIIRVSEGDTTIIDVDSYSYKGKKFQGVVMRIANTANKASSPHAVVEFKVEVRILNESFRDLMSEIKSPSPFRPGMTASVEIITTTKKDVLSAPLSAVTTRNSKKVISPKKKEEGFFDDDEEDAMSLNTNTNRPEGKGSIKEVVFVWVEGIAKMREVETGISDYSNIEIRSGLKEGELVISGPFFAVSKQLKEGDLVVRD